MRCIHCLTENSLRQRKANNGRCSKCGRIFALEPAKYGVTDKLVLNAIQHVSVNQTLYFTEKQFFYSIQSKILSLSVINIGPLALFGLSVFLYVFFFAGPVGLFLTSLGVPEFIFPIYIIILMLLLSSSCGGPPNSVRRKASIGLMYVLAMLMIVHALAVFPAFNVSLISLLVAAFGIGIGIRMYYKRYRNPSFRDPCRTVSASLVALKQFSSVHGGAEKLLPPISSEETGCNSDSSMLAQAEDLRSYSFDRVLFCETKSIVQFLIANHFHFEHNCAVLTADGYPSAIYSIAIEMLKNNASLKVFCVHDCTVSGMLFLSRLKATQAWLQEANLPICDLGLLPRQVIRNPLSFRIVRLKNKVKKPFARVQFPISVSSYLRPREVKWLSQGFYVELESIPPQRLLQFLGRSLHQQRTLEQLEPDVFPLLGDSTIYGGPESFG